VLRVGMSRTVPVDSWFTRSFRYRTLRRTLPYVANHLLRKPFRSSPEARASTAHLTSPEFHRVVHDLYCDMFLRGYRRVTGFPVEHSTGLVLVLFAVFIYAFDDEFEKRRLRGDGTEVEQILAAPAVLEVWEAIGAFLRATGRTDELRHHILTEFLGAGFDGYRRDVEEAATRGGFAVTVRLVEFDSGASLRTAYHLIRLFNRQPIHHPCADEFYHLGMAGKFLDDMADYVDDVRFGNPNLLHAMAAEDGSNASAARAALLAGEPITMRWWAQHCPATYQRYLRQTREHVDRVAAPDLRLPLDIYLTLLASRKFWTISTVRASRRAG
jgi:hypothetical protein